MENQGMVPHSSFAASATVDAPAGTWPCSNAADGSKRLPVLRSQPELARDHFKAAKDTSRKDNV